MIETLREVDPTRKCYRMVGGILVERTVKEVLPALEGNREQVTPGQTSPPSPTDAPLPSPTALKLFSPFLLQDQQNHRDAEPAAAEQGPRTE